MTRTAAARPAAGPASRVAGRSGPGAGGGTTWRQALVAASLPWLVARVAVVAGLLLAAVAEGAARAGAPDAARPGLAWDGASYVGLAEDGYSPDVPETLRFFPLFPLLVRGLGTVLFGQFEAAALVVANLSALALGVLLFRLVVAERGDPVLARRAVWLVTLFPAAAVLALGYAEATSMALAVGGFLALRRRHWALAAVMGVLVGLARPVGVLFAVPAAVEAWRGWRGVTWRERGARLAAAVAPLAGTAAYLAWSAWRFDDFWLPLRVQQEGHLRGETVFPLVRVFEAGVDAVSGRAPADGVHLGVFAAFAGLVVLVARRWPGSYAWYAGALLVVAFSAANLSSFERYALAAFPALLALAELVHRPVVARTALTVSGAGFVAYTALAMLGYVVP